MIERQGVTHATATSAAAAHAGRGPGAHCATRAMTSGGRIELAVEVDPSLLGGLVVRVGDRLIDGSVRGRLERLRNQLTSGAL
ncbi:MAG: F0F1 ATP synthase subunit delta [Candidatus Limnocylindrales bacterium]